MSPQTKSDPSWSPARACGLPSSARISHAPAGGCLPPQTFAPRARRFRASQMSEAVDLISGDALKAAALRFLGEVRTKVDREQSGLLRIFDSWFSRGISKPPRLYR